MNLVEHATSSFSSTRQETFSLIHTIATWSRSNKTNYFTSKPGISKPLSIPDTSSFPWPRSKTLARFDIQSQSWRRQSCVTMSTP